MWLDHRGLIVPCSECERRAFYRIELLGESNACPRCGAPAYVTAARRSEREEPEWFYDLHGRCENSSSKTVMFRSWSAWHSPSAPAASKVLPN
jgi:hypothetical protein